MSHRKVVRWILIGSCVVISFPVLVLSFLHFAYADPEGNGSAIRSALVTGIDEAKSVEILIHSDESDFIFLDEKPNKELMYQRITLDPQQRKILRDSILNSSRRTQNLGGILGFSRCGFQDHHSILFQSDIGEVSRVRLCFICDAAQAPGMTRHSSWLGLKTIREGFEALGVPIDLDWREAAEINK